MPTFYADQIATTSAGTIARTSLGDRHPGPDLTPRTNVAHLTYTMKGTEVALDKVRLMKGRQGMKILPHLSLVTSNAVATTCTIDIGDDDVAGVGAAVDADRYADGLDVAAAGIDLFNSQAPTTAARTTPYALGADAWIELTFATLATPIEGRKLEILLAYTGA